MKYCPDRDRRERLLDDGLDDSELYEMEQHVEGGRDKTALSLGDELHPFLEGFEKADATPSSSPLDGVAK